MNIKYLVFDVDGTLTDGKIYMGESGEVFKAFSIKDGCAIHDIMPKYDITPIIITARDSKIVRNRCAELNITHIYQNCRNKADKIAELAGSFGIPCENGKYKGFAYMGDDILDIPGMKVCEAAGCPKDAVEEVKAVCDFISSKNGGDGAAREFVEWLIK